MTHRTEHSMTGTSPPLRDTTMGVAMSESSTTEDKSDHNEDDTAQDCTVHRSHHEQERELDIAEQIDNIDEPVK